MKTLTPRELTCLGWAAIGKTSWGMGVILGLTERTVNFHIHNACKKLQVHSRQAAITALLRAGMLPNITGHPPPAPSKTPAPATLEMRLHEPSPFPRPAHAAAPKS